MINMQQFLAMLAPRYTARQQTPVSFNLKHPIVSEQQLHSYSLQLRKIYDHFFNNNKNKLEIDKVLHFPVVKTKVPLCNKILQENQAAYKCYDCFIHQAAALCVQCFENGQHSGHRFQRFASGGGNCDCGNSLAMKEQGFCKNHSGKIQIPQINSKQQQIFQYIFGNMLQWFFKLINLNESFAQVFGMQLFSYLKKINDQSIYYNILTYKLFTKNTEAGQNYLKEVFKIKSGRLQLQINELFFSMFALDEFKSILADHYLTAYNTIIGIEKSSFHSLYIQLFANDNIVFDVVNKFKNTIHVVKDSYDVQKYLMDINFISTITNSPAFAFYQLYFKVNGTVSYPFLDQVQKFFEKSDKMHSVDLVTKSIINQNAFYFLFASLYEKIKNNQSLLILVTRQLLFKLSKNQYSYVKNRAIFPYHRVFSIGIFALFQGDNQVISAKKIAQKLNVQQQLVLNVYQKAASEVMNCFFDFCQTFVKRNYFDNYITLYARSGFICITLDQLLVKQAIVILSKSQQHTKCFLDMFIKKFQQQKSSWMTQNRSTLSQFINTWIYVYDLIFQITAKNSYEIIIAQRLKIKNEALKKKRTQLFSQIMKKIGPIGREEIVQIQKFFIHTVNDQFLIQNTEFNKVTKKYSRKQANNNQSQQLFYNIYLSKRKTGQIILKQEQQKAFIQKIRKQNVTINKQAQKIIPFVFPVELISKLVQFACKNKNKLDEKQKYNTGIKMLSLLAKLSLGQNVKLYLQYFEKINTQFQVQQIKYSKKNEQNAQIQSLLLKKKHNDKKAKFMEKQKNIAAKYSAYTQTQHPVIQQNDNICILCRDATKEKESLCYFGNIKYKQLMSLSQQTKTFGYVISSCFHASHWECFKQLFKKNKNRVACPLCKASCNILLPVNPQTENIITIKSKQRLQHIMKILLKQQNVLKQQEEEQIKQQKIVTFIQILNSIVEQVGFVGVIKPQYFQKHSHRVCILLYRMLILQWRSYNGYEKQLIFQQMQKQLQKNKKQLKQKQVNTQIIMAIKKCILNVLFNLIQQKQVNLSTSLHFCQNKLNYQDYSHIKLNLEKIINPNAQSSEHLIAFQSQAPGLITLYKFYQPPRTVKQLLIQRDETTLKNCKNGHNVCICCQCSKVVCIDCKTLLPHRQQHGCDTICFSLLLGNVFIYINRKISFPSLYQNKLGAVWNQSKNPQGFQLNRELYEQLVLNVTTHTIQQFLRNKMPKILDQGQQANFLILPDNQDDY